jgi:hypothetical protein
MEAKSEGADVKINTDSETTATESLNTSGISSTDSIEDGNDFTEEDMKKAEEYKSKGNDFFKCKQEISH